MRPKRASIVFVVAGSALLVAAPAATLAARARLAHAARRAPGARAPTLIARAAEWGARAEEREKAARETVPALVPETRIVQERVGDGETGARVVLARVEGRLHVNIADEDDLALHVVDV